MNSASKAADQMDHAGSGTEVLLTAFEAIAEHHYVDSDGVRIHYAAMGQGPLLVLLHGFPDHWLGWWQVMADLCADYRVVALDLRGYHLSDAPPDPQAYLPTKLVADVAAVVEREGVSKATLLGHDWGGFIAWHAAMQAQPWLERLVVLNMPHPWAIARELSNNPQQRVASDYVRAFRQPQSHLQLPMSGLGAWIKDPAFKRRHDQAMAISTLETMLHYYRVNWPAEPYFMPGDMPPKVRVPTLLIHGLADPYALPAGLNDVWQWVDNELSIQTIPDASHFIQHDNAQQVVRIVRTWLHQQTGGSHQQTHTLPIPELHSTSSLL